MKMSNNGNITRPSASGSGSGSGVSSSSSSPTKRSIQNLLALPNTTRSSSPLPRSPTSPSRTLFAPPPLHLTVRFSTSLPDLHLDILTPHQTTIAALKHRIRARLAADAASKSPLDNAPKRNAFATAARGRLRFIHGGKILPDSATLSSVLKPLPPPPSASGPGHTDPKGKGKGVEGRLLQRVYVNCSIGDELSVEDLALEAAAATSTTTTTATNPSTPSPANASFIPHSLHGANSTGIYLDTGHGLGVRSTTSGTAHRQRGFDRLLMTGFTPAEVNQLRLQFRSIQAARHTPDTMPSPDSLRSMEDAWIDSNGAAGAGAPSGMGTSGEDGDTTGTGAGEDAIGLNAMVDAMVKGMFIGFVFPLGSIGWLLREEGIWPKRVQVFVSLGFLVSLLVGLILALGGQG